MRVSSLRAVLATGAALAVSAASVASGQVAAFQRLATALVGEVAGVDVDDEEDYWLGVSCTDLSDDLRDELKLDEANGVVVMDVVPDSPAAKAGLKKHDVLLAADDADVTTPRDVVKAVRKVKSKELKLTLVRDGERKEITAKPEKRGDQEAERAWRSGRQGEPFNVRIFRPGHVLPPRVAITFRRHELPDDMTVTVTKHGKDSAKITVAQADKTWEVTEDKLDDLPEEVRPHAEAILGRFSIPLPPGVDKVLTYGPEGDQFFININADEAKKAARQAVREAEETAREARREAEAAHRKVDEAAREAHRAVMEKARDARRVAEEAAREKADAAIEKGRVWIDKQLDEKFDELDRRLEELRGMINSLRESRKTKAEEKSPADKP